MRKEDLGDKKNRDLQVKLGLYMDPVDELTPNLKQVILSKMLLIF